MEITLGFGDGRVVEARVKDRIIKTDQSVKAGGTASAPEPFDLFLASIATCAGFYVMDFCLSRGISIEGLGMKMTTEKNPEKRMISRIGIAIELPPGFPPKYHKAVVRAVGLCSVKRHLDEPPVIETFVVE